MLLLSPPTKQSCRHGRRERTAKQRVGWQSIFILSSAALSIDTRHGKASGFIKSRVWQPSHFTISQAIIRVYPRNEDEETKHSNYHRRRWLSFPPLDWHRGECFATLRQKVDASCPHLHPVGGLRWASWAHSCLSKLSCWLPHVTISGIWLCLQSIKENNGNRICTQGSAYGVHVETYES